MFLRELKEEGVIKVHWIITGDNPLDLFTKNLDTATFKKHVKTICEETRF